MSTSLDIGTNGNLVRPTHPRARQLSQSAVQNGFLKPDSADFNDDGLTSGTATPIPADAPPSVHAASSARKQIRAEQKQRMFPTVEFTSRVSHFDPNSEHRDFHGFFNLFWVALTIMVITTVLRNIKETGYPFRLRQRETFLKNIWELAIIDAAMVGSTMVSLPLHKVYAGSKNWLRWKSAGIWIQGIFQAVWLLCWVEWPFLRNWTWTAQVFFTMHLLVMFMKMHSYAFYNGHLSEIKKRLDELDHAEITGVSKRRPLVRYPSTTTRLRDFHETLEVAPKQPPLKTLSELREDLAIEITSPLGHVTYPQNVTVGNFVDFLCCPTLCYELEYPRTERLVPMELFYKTLAVFGCIFLMTLTTEEFVIPVLDDANLRLKLTPYFLDGALIFAETVSRLLFPFMVIFLLVFLSVFEYILGAMAEITCFGDRHFYDDWWNSCDWLEFSREWNIPVHQFFRRHVYLASRGTFSRSVATSLTFFVSALAHELIMGCITKKLRGYGAFALMLQIPIVMLQRSRWGKGRTVLNNVLFWFSMILGLSLMCALYVLF